MTKFFKGPLLQIIKQGGHPHAETKFTDFSLTKFSFSLTKILRFYDLFIFFVKNNSKKAYQLVKDLTAEKQGKSTTIQDKSEKCLTEENEILNRWTEYCSDLYYYENDGDPIVLDCPNEEHHPILGKEMEAAVQVLKMGRSASVDNIPEELAHAGGEAMTYPLTAIYKKIWKTGEWPTTWTQSLVITVSKKGNLQLCQNYRTISLISHPSKVMLKIVLDRLPRVQSCSMAAQGNGSELQ